MIRRLAAAAALLVLAACGEATRPPTDGDAGGKPATPPPAAAKALTVKGSDTMVIMAQRVAEKFMAKNPGKIVQVTGGGTGTGIAALINGTTEIADASRPMKDKEKAEVKEKRGADVIEHKVALDGLAVFVHEKNTIKEIDLDQLRKIYLGEIKNWKEVGGSDSPIVTYGRENSSGTYAYFKEHVLKEKDFAAEVQTLPGTAAVVNAVAKDPKAIGYGGIAYDKGIRAVPVKKDAASPAVEPSMENVTSGTYPISRHLFMYTAGEPTGTAKELIEYVLSDEGQKVVSEVGYYPLPKPGAAPAPAPAVPPAAPPPPAGTK